MSISRSHFRNRILLLVDIAAMVVSYVLMLTFRFRWQFKKTWQVPLYSMVLVTEVLMCALIDVYKARKRNYRSVEKCDPLEVLSETFRNQSVLFALLLIVLMFTQYTKRMSRIAMVVLFLLNNVVVYVFRMVYRAILKKRGNPEIHRRKLAVVCYAKDETAIRGRLFAKLDEEFALMGVITLDEAYPTDVVRTAGDSLEKKRDDIVNRIYELGCGDILLCIPDVPANETYKYVRKDITKKLSKKGINTYFALSVDGVWLTQKLIRGMGYYETSYFSAMAKRCRVLGVNFAVSNVENAVLYVKSHLKEFAGKYICYCNVHTTVEASEDAEYLGIQNGSALTFPDGQPIVNRIQKAGFVNAERIAGPDFMEAMFYSTMDGKVSHFFYGSSEETIELLKKNLPEKFPGMDIRGYYSPPFRPLTPEEDDEVVRMLNASGADLIWIGLGAPKQERWMAEHKDRLSGVMLGVGAGFNFFAGNIKRAPLWVQKIGMEWLYRLFQDPKRLFKRYLESNAKFIWKIFIQGK